MKTNSNILSDPSEWGTVPRIQLKFPLWISIEIDWNRNAVDFFSPICSMTFLPISFTSLWPLELFCICSELEIQCGICYLNQYLKQHQFICLMEKKITINKTLHQNTQELSVQIWLETVPESKRLFPALLKPVGPGFNYDRVWIILKVLWTAILQPFDLQTPFLQHWKI